MTVLIYIKKNKSVLSKRKNVDARAAEDKSKRRTGAGEQVGGESSRRPMQIRSLLDGGFRPGEQIRGVVHLFVHYQESSTPARSTNDSSRRKDMFSGIPMVKLLPVEPKRGLEETGGTQERPEAQGELRPSGE